jgi:hypothetical protein
MECGAILDVVRLLAVTSDLEWNRAKSLLVDEDEDGYDDEDGARRN